MDEREREVAVRRALTDVDREVRVWLGDHEALPRTDLSAVAGAFRRGVGEASAGRLRSAPAAELGVFAAEHDTVLYEFDDDPTHGALLGYPAGENRWAPVVVCAAGPAEAAGDLVASFVEAAERATDGEVARP
jgi:predicted lipoprotein with Yx(FWY)xxD motif